MNTTSIESELELAKRTLRSGSVAQAEAMYRGILDVRPGCGEAIHFLGLAEMKQRNLEEALRLMRRSVELEPGRGEFHNNLATVLGQLNRTAEALQTAERAIALRPEAPEAWNNKGFALERLGRMGDAIPAYRQAVRLRADYFEAMANLGNALFHAGQCDEAVTWLREVARQKPRNASAHKKLAAALRRSGQMIESIDSYRTALQLAPKDADLLNDLGGALQETGDRKSALDLLLKCIEMKPNHPDGHWNLALALLAMGRWEEGWAEYEWRSKLRLDAGQKRNFLQAAWDGSNPAGKTLFVNCEQGLGDAIQFVRYAGVLKAKGARVIVECQPPLLRLLQSVRGLDGVMVRGEPLPAFDFHVRLMSLPGLLGSTPDQMGGSPVPYLHAEEKRAKELRAYLGVGSAIKVGLVWQGRPEHKGDRQRSMQLAMFEPLARVEGVRLVSLQKNPGADQIEKVRGRMELLEWSNPGDISAESWVDTAAMMSNLDLVIGVDTSVCHLAGAMGIPTWLALPYAADWRWMEERDDTPWYPTMRLFRQKALGNWSGVVERIAVELRLFAAASR